MDLPCVPWQDHVAQKWIGLDAESKEKFTSLQEIDDVFKCALNLTTQNDLDVLQSISAAYNVQKAEDKAARCREKGNSSFKSRNYSAAALHYSQGLCAAPQTSEQLPLCYANRSAALYHLQLYQECLDDIDKALKSGYPSHLVHKLQDRRTKCLKDLHAHEKAKEDDCHPASRSREGPGKVKAPSAQLHMFGICPQAAVSSSVEKGRHLVAVEGIAAGEVILGDRPYSCVLIPGLQEVNGSRREDADVEVLATESRRCHRCLAGTLCPVPCEGCRYSRYCSTGCQREAWEEHHRWECPLGADLTAMGVMLQLALRVALKAGSANVQMAREPITDDQTEPQRDCLGSEFSLCPSYKGVFDLLHHLHRHSPALRFLCAVTVATVYLKLSRTSPPPASWRLQRSAAAGSQSPGGPDREDVGWSSELLLQLGSAVLRHMLQLRCNAQAIVAQQDTGAENLSVQSSREIRIATAIFPTLSLLNHSCRPNTSLAFDTGSQMPADSSVSVAEDERAAGGVAVTVRAARVIAPGQEILHCYGPHSSRMATRKRQRLLQEQYFFLCQCEACSLQQQEEEEEEEEGKEQRPGAGGVPKESAVLCCKCKGALKKSLDDRGKEFLCSLPSCGHRMSSSEVRNRLQQVSVDLQEAVELLEAERAGEALKLLKRTQCQSGVILAETHPLQGELADATARAYATMGDWKNAAAQLERSAVAIGSQYGEDSIELGQQLFKLAQLHFNGGARGPALSVIRKVRRLLCLHLGPHCPELQELKAMEDCLRGSS